jgi:hypothetical protein
MALGGIKPFYLILIPIVLLIGVGAYYNNLTSNGFSTTAATSTCTEINCPAYQDTGCSTVSNCNFTSSTNFSFLNPNSPFTYLTQGDIIGFVGSFATNQAQQGPTANFDLASPCTIVSGTGTLVTKLKCTSLSFASGNTEFYPNIPYTNFTSASGNNSEWYCTNCLTTDGGSQIIPIQFYGAYNNASLSGVACGVNDTSYCLFNLNSQQSSHYTSSSALTNTFSFFGFIIGILLLLMSLQLGGGASISLLGSVSWQIGDQGARLAQTAGIGLLIYLPIYSEFGSVWITSANLGFGIAAIIQLLIPAIFMAGVYWQLASYF